MTRPLIGLVPLVDIGRQSLWMLPAYMDALERSGGAPVMLPLTSDAGVLERVVSACDGLLITGGQDVNPALYGRDRGLCGELCDGRDGMETPLFELALKRDIPVLGICRGMQFINVALGGTLYRDIPTEHPTPLCHRQSAPYDRPSHEVAIEAGSPLDALFGVRKLGVNSCHHQAVERLSDRLRAAARADDGLIEAFYMPSARFVLGVQWHPELSFAADECSRRIFAEFVGAAAR